MKKFLKYAAVAIFMFALVLNIKFSLSDPFMFTSDLVLAQESESSSSDDEKNTPATYECPDGSSCDGVICEPGTIDCTPMQCCPSDTTITIAAIRIMNVKDPIGHDRFDNEMKKLELGLKAAIALAK